MKRFSLKKSAILCLALTMLCGSTVSAAEPATASNELSMGDVVKYQNNNMRSNSNEIVVTNPIVIRELATKQGFPDVENIKKLTYTVGTTLQNEETIPEPRAITSWLQVGDVKDQGTGYMLVDHFTENRYEGPMSGTKSFSRTNNNSFNATMGITSDLISAKVGFTIGSSVTVTDSVNLTIPAGKKILLKVWTNYQKKTFTIYREYSNAVGLWYPEGSGNAYRPVGLIFTQAEY